MSKFYNFLKSIPSDLKTYDRMVLVTIRGLIEDYGDNVFPAYDTIAELTGMSKRQVIRIVQRLANRGLILVDERRDSNRQLSNSYSLSPELMEFVNPKESECGSPPMVSHSEQVSSYKAIKKDLKQEEEDILYIPFENEVLRYKIPQSMARRILNEVNDIRTYSAEAIRRAFKKAMNRTRYSAGLYNFPKWFATTLRNEQFYLDQQAIAAI